MIQRIFHYYSKYRQIGAVRFYKAAIARLQKYGGRAVLAKGAAPNPSIGILSFVRTIQMSSKQLIVLADQYTCNQFSFLGSRSACYLEMPWYEDVRNRDSFDIKVPWECARFHYAPVLAHAYLLTGNQSYFTAIKKQILSFLDAASFGQGIHWSNPMECAIRATNWIVAYQLLQNELKQDRAFHDRFVQSLWQHMVFIEDNWELYDGRTNNHYLSNLVGYAYLCSFFNDSKRWQHCWKELHCELAWQIQNDGSSYEGSTAYHGFVTELFLHGFLIAHSRGEIISRTIQEKLIRMMQFADATKELCIGDDDSGSLLHCGLYDLYALAQTIIDMQRPKKQRSMHFKQFGVSIISYNVWKISLRHHAYHGRQPSAHFHEDVGSITLSYNDIPILIDPGTYLYTGSKIWRNYFRSAVQHSMFYPIGWSQKTNDLFELHIPEGQSDILQSNQAMTLTHQLYGYPVKRTISWNDERISVLDDVRHATTAMEWQFLFAPGIELHNSVGGMWDIMHAGKCILQFRSDSLIFKKRESWVAPAYGIKEKIWALCAQGADVACDAQVVKMSFHAGE